jgi:hypothetical protein
MKILFPVFQFSLQMQKNKSSIRIIIPTLNIMFSKWNRMELTSRNNKFCIFLLNCQKNGIIWPETIIKRCFLKTNIKLLNELNEK